MARKVAATETVPCASRKARSASLGFTLNERKGEIAAEDDAAGAGDAVVEARRHRADAGNRHDAERDAGDKDAEAAQAAAQIAPGKSKREVQRGELFGIAAGASISAPSA